MESFHYLSSSQGTKLTCTHKSKDAWFVFQYFKILNGECILKRRDIKKKRSIMKWTTVHVWKSELLLSHVWYVSIWVFFFIFLQVEQEVNRLGSNVGSTSSSSRGGGVGMHYGVGAGGGGQWKPALQSISETGTWKAQPCTFSTIFHTS